jgi:hypothetical protein
MPDGFDYCSAGLSGLETDGKIRGCEHRKVGVLDDVDSQAVVQLEVCINTCGPKKRHTYVYQCVCEHGHTSSWKILTPISVAAGIRLYLTDTLLVRRVNMPAAETATSPKSRLDKVFLIDSNLMVASKAVPLGSCVSMNLSCISRKTASSHSTPTQFTSIIPGPVQCHYKRQSSRRHTTSSSRVYLLLSTQPFSTTAYLRSFIATGFLKNRIAITHLARV